MGGSVVIERGFAVLGNTQIKTAEVKQYFTDQYGTVCTLNIYGYQHYLRQKELAPFIHAFALMRAYAQELGGSPPSTYALHIFHKFNKTVELISENNVRRYPRLIANYALGQCLSCSSIAVATYPIKQLKNNGMENLADNVAFAWVLSHELMHATHELLVDDYPAVYKEHFSLLETDCEQTSAFTVGILTGRTKPIETENPYISKSRLSFETRGCSVENPLYAAALISGTLGVINN